MSDRDDSSFDPKTWVVRRPSESAAMRDSEPSFDVRSWGTGAAAPPTPPSPPPAATTVRLHDPFFASAEGRRQALGFVAGALLFLTGAAVAFVSREQPRGATQAKATKALAGTPERLSSRRTLVLAGAAEIEGTLRSAGVATSEAAEAARQAVGALGQQSGEIRLIFDLDTVGTGVRLIAIEATRSDGGGIVLSRLGDGRFAAKRLSAALKTRLTVVRGEMDSESFYSSAVAAGVTDSLISDFANAFSFDFDMQREVAPGDIFEAAFEQAYNPVGEAVGVPRLVYVSLRTSTKSRALYRFTPAGERDSGWFDGNGFSTVRSLMRTPVDSARITSQFGMRTHPILGYQKMHRGTDFAAPTGTPIFASGSATVDFAGPKGANGNFVRLRHENGWQTLYLHMNRILPGVVAGARVAQGQQIGEVGTTGRSTGPHLHYEVHVEGQPIDPLSIETGAGKSLSDDMLAAFRKERDRVDAQRARSGG
ncbi:M23 family metallopeptidase [Allosphingosinicella deserti]|uniref:M23ase beta-sheet core domain-containing protein n=1 Tax=Allosphingosinicella deserti TaxID=2116704 RepID=A0A2P7QFW6_9SPHN|nr:M23 family metallopeptidase [Sphingomonas deserti]PSJ36840.1 hypothetical protein C7I55_24315 [Sphingomonas deserti]